MTFTQHNRKTKTFKVVKTPTFILYNKNFMINSMVAAYYPLMVVFMKSIYLSGLTPDIIKLPPDLSEILLLTTGQITKSLQFLLQSKSRFLQKKIPNTQRFFVCC